MGIKFLKIVTILLCLTGCFLKKETTSVIELKDYYKYNLPIEEEQKDLDHYLNNALKRLKVDSKDFVTLTEAAELYFEKGRRDNNIKDLQQALDYVKKSLAIESTKYNKNAKLLLAKLYENQHRFKEALKISEEVLSQTSSPGAVYVLVNSNLALGNLKEAEKQINILVNVYPRVGTVGLLGLVLISQGRYDEGVKTLERAIKLEDIGEQKDSSWARAILGRHFLKHNRLADARILLEESLRIKPKSGLTLDLLAQLEAQEKNFINAENYLKQAISNSKDYVYRRHLADIYKAQGKNLLAEATWKETEKEIQKDLDLGFIDHRMDMVKLLMARNQSGDAKKALDLVVAEKKDRVNGDILFLMAKAQKELGQKNEASKSLEELLALGPKESSYYELASDLYAIEGKEIASKDMLKKSKEIDEKVLERLAFY